MNTEKTSISINVWKEGNIFVSKCSELEISSSGNSIVESIRSLSEAIELWFENMEELTNRISIDSDVCHGKPCIKGTRVMVSVIKDCLTNGMSKKEIIKEYQSLTEDDIKAVILYKKENQKSDKEIALGVIKKLPDDIGFDEIQNHLFAAQKINKALKRSDFEENGIPHKDVVKKLFKE